MATEKVWVCKTMYGSDDMTEMKRRTVSLPEEIDKKVLELRKDERFIRCSYSEIVRKLLEAGLAAQALRA